VPIGDSECPNGKSTSVDCRWIRHCLYAVGRPWSLWALRRRSIRRDPTTGHTAMRKWCYGGYAVDFPYFSNIWMHWCGHRIHFGCHLRCHCLQPRNFRAPRWRVTRKLHRSGGGRRGHSRIVVRAFNSGCRRLHVHGPSDGWSRVTNTPNQGAMVLFFLLCLGWPPLMSHIFFAPRDFVSWVKKVRKLDTEALPIHRAQVKPGRLHRLRLVSSLPTSASCQASWQGSNTLARLSALDAARIVFSPSKHPRPRIER